MSGDFSPEQKRYLEGFVAGLQIAKAARVQGGAASAAAAEPSGPDAAHLHAQDRVLKAGGKLSEQEKFKRELHPFDGYERLKAQVARVVVGQDQVVEQLMISIFARGSMSATW